MKKVLVAILIVGGLAMWFACRNDAVNHYRLELSRISCDYIHGEECLDERALIYENRFKWVRRHLPHEKARARFKARLEKLHSKYAFWIQ